MLELRQAILKTLVYFDLFYFPLTLMEVWKWLYLPAMPSKAWQAGQPDKAYSLAQVQEALDNFQSKIATKDGFYFLKNRQELISKRLARYNLAEKKLKRAIRFIKIFRFIPFIKMIAVCNSLAYSNSTPAGDIDLFIIAEKNRLWLTRLLTVGWLKLMGVRPTLKSKQDAIDANYFVADGYFNLKTARVASNELYLVFWLDQMVPIFDPYGIYEKFKHANSWLKSSLPNAFGYNTNPRRQVLNTPLIRAIRFKLKLFLNYDWLEAGAKKFQLKIMPAELKSIINRDTRVMVNDGLLKFHRVNRLEEYLNKFKEKLSTYEIS